MGRRPAAIVERVRIDEFATFETLEVGAKFTDAQCSGAFIRLRPGRDNTDAEIADYKAALECKGARVKVLPRPQQEVAAVQAEVDREVGSLRDELKASLGAAVNVVDVDRVSDAIEECLAEVGL